MSPSNVRRAALLAAAAVVASATSASAFDFSNPSDKRAYCQVYARQALNDVQSSQTRGCGFTGVAWSNDFNEQFNWCMSQSDVGATTQENVTRSTAVEQCSGSASQFPPVVADTPVQTASNFPPVVANEAVEQPSAFPPVVASDPPQVADEPVVQSASFPPVVQSSGSKSSRSSSGRTAEVSFPPVVDEGEVGGDPDMSDIATTDPFAERGERMRQVAERLIEFGREHEDEIREAAHKVKEKFKQKLSDLKEQHDNGGDQVADKLKAKIKQKLSNFKEQPGKHSDTMAGKFKQKIKQKLSNLKDRGGNGHGQGENSLRSKVKGALKEGLMRRLANR